MTDERINRTEKLIGYFLDGATEELKTDVQEVFAELRTLQQQNKELEDELSNANEANKIVAELHDKFQQQNKQLIEGIDKVCDGMSYYSPAYQKLQHLILTIKGG